MKPENIAEAARWGSEKAGGFHGNWRGKKGGSNRAKKHLSALLDLLDGTGEPFKEAN